jgi:spore germination protein
MEIYVVQPGDTLSAIAARFGVSLGRLVEVNGLPNPDRLVVGQAILIPEPPQQFLIYTVAPGDTLYRIAQLFDTTIQMLVEVNDIENPDLLNIGQELIIPGWIGIEYTVRPGDTLWAISRQFGVSVGLIARINQIENPSLIFPFQTLIIPQPVPEVVKPEAETLAYVFSDLSGLQRALSVAGQCLTYTALFQFRVDRTGDLIAPANPQAVANLSRQYGIAPLAVVTNWEGDLFQPGLARDIMSNDVVRARTIASIRDALSRYGFAGVNIDFENMYPEDRPLFNQFIRELREALKPQGYLVTIAVAPKASDRPNEPWVGIFDYATLGSIVDIMYIMTYEWGWVGGPPMAIAPINQVRRVLAYATSLVPPEKIIQGIPLYGYNWPLPDTPESRATTVTLTGAYDLAFNAGVNILYDDISQSPWFRYTDAQGILHEVWFEDPRSLRAKYELAQEFGLRGVGFWTSANANYGFRQIWSLLCDTFTVTKLST